MLDLDPHILRSMLEDARRELDATKAQLAAARAGEMKWEHEAKALRREIQRLRMECDTERLHKPK